jgi:hypothetical protein
VWATKFHTRIKQPARVLCILIFTFSDCKLEDKRFCIEWQQAFPDFNLLLISSWMEFWFVVVAPKYLNRYTFSNDLLTFCMFPVCTCFQCWGRIFGPTNFRATANSCENAGWHEQGIGKLVPWYDTRLSRGGDYVEKQWNSYTVTLYCSLYGVNTKCMHCWAVFRSTCVNTVTCDFACLVGLILCLFVYLFVCFRRKFTDRRGARSGTPSYE